MSRTLKVQLLAAVTAFALVAVLVVRTSAAFFSGTTDTAGSWDAGTVTLTDDDGTTYAAASLTVTDVKPGDKGYDCIEVTYGGSLVGTDLDASGVKLYASTVTNTDGAGGDTSVASGKLSDDLDVTVETMIATTYGTVGCATWGGEEGGTELHGTEIVAPTTVDSVGTSYATGHGTWVPAAQNEKLVYLIHWTLGTDTANDAQGDGVDVTFRWEARSA